PYTTNYINNKYGVKHFESKFDFTMEILFKYSDKYSEKLHNGRKESLTFEEVKTKFLDSDVFGYLTNGYDYEYNTIRRYIKKSAVHLGSEAYHEINRQGTIYMKKQGIKRGSSFFEEMMRVYMRYIFDKSFYKAKPSWLKGMSIKGGDLELDGYNEELGIAFETDGPFHYDVNAHMDRYGLTLRQAEKRLEIQQANDRIKTEECARRGITLIRIKLYDIKSLSDFQTAIEQKYKTLTKKEAPKRPPLDHKIAVRFIKSNFLGWGSFW
ncbi:hypothetical protein LCGC14_2638450, partial [marine sediment metagenome]